MSSSLDGNCVRQGLVSSNQSFDTGVLSCSLSGWHLKSFEMSSLMRSGWHCFLFKLKALAICMSDMEQLLKYPALSIMFS
jgi:hypothetical protein